MDFLYKLWIWGLDLILNLLALLKFVGISSGPHFESSVVPCNTSARATACCCLLVFVLSPVSPYLYGLGSPIKKEGIVIESLEMFSYSWG